MATLLMFGTSFIGISRDLVRSGWVGGGPRFDFRSMLPANHMGLTVSHCINANPGPTGNLIRSLARVMALRQP